MKKLLLLTSILFLLSACGSVDSEEHTEEIKGIQVDFTLPETANTGETVLLQTTITYGDDELVVDAEEMTFEYWNIEDEEHTINVDATNHKDGTYSSEVIFNEPGTYEIYAHTTAKGMHSMPLKSITINGETHDHGAHTETNKSEHQHDDNFEIKLHANEDIAVNESIDITVELFNDHEPVEGARVRYEIIPENSDKHDWIDAEETKSGEYTSSHTFNEAGHTTMIVHVTDDNGLHEHEEFHFDITE